MSGQDSMYRDRKEGSLGTLLVPADWKVMVLKLSGIIDIPYDHMYVHTITMSGCMDRCYH